ncbi:MAG: carboxypeptidase-like regulatory domain-containing protein [Prevotellaceae bacterium]|jgi:hypothetical protein|nr:carboxypeptidase-like regulatory domain-containing protein [Prevotellaceae bacterium]
MKLSAFFLFLFVPLALLAQIQGITLEEGSNFPVSFASVKFQSGGKQHLVIADNKGQFFIQNIDNKEITVTCLGYIPQKV